MYKPLYLLILFLFVSCSQDTAKIKNTNFGKLKATHQLAVLENKKYPLDSVTATKPVYMQLYTDSTGFRILTVLNDHQNAIYMYDYEGGDFIKEITYEKEGPNGILRLAGYYIKNPDSIYVYDGRSIGIALTDNNATIKNKVVLRETDDPAWALYNPQYSLSTVTPFISYEDSYILTGFAPFSLPSADIEKFKFSLYVDEKTNHIEYHHTYPKELYGFDYNWDGAFATIVYPAISADGKLIHSFPASHHLYISDLKSGSSAKVYAGSNVAQTIHSINHEPRRTPGELIKENVLQEDSYGAILYDSYREVYYRFFLKGIPTATKDSPLYEKPIIIIVMDKQFNYLGETAIGTEKEWNWKNSFVTKEGLNIEYIDSQDFDEKYLNLKLLTLEELK